MTHAETIKAIDDEIRKELGVGLESTKGCFGTLVYSGADPECLRCKVNLACRERLQETKFEQMADISIELARINEELNITEEIDEPVEAVETIETVGEPIVNIDKMILKSRAKVDWVHVIKGVLAERPANYKAYMTAIKEHVGEGHHRANYYEYGRRILEGLISQNIVRWDGDKKHVIEWA